MHWLTELTADFVGHDLSQGYAERFSRFTQIDAALARSGGADGTTDDDSAGASDEEPGAGDFAPTDGFDDVVAGAFDAKEPAEAVF
jgi:hypothetical protein